MPSSSQIKPVHLALVALLSLCAFTFTHAADAPMASTAPASESTDGMVARLILTPGYKARGVLFLYPVIEFENVTGAPIKFTQSSLWVRLTVTGSNGYPIAPESQPQGLAQVSPGFVGPIAPKAKSATWINAYEKPGDSGRGCMLATRAGTWLLAPEDDAVFIEGVIIASNQSPSADSNAPTWRIPKTRIPTAPVKLSPAEAGQQIQTLGPQIFLPGSAGKQYQNELSLIDDDRAILWYQALLNTGDPELKIHAIDQLSRFSTDEAFAAIKEACQTHTSQLAPPFNFDGENQMASRITVEACRALARIKHPQAINALLEQTTSRDSAVKREVAILLAAVPTPEARQALAALAKDPIPQVSQEAKLSTAILDAKANKTDIPQRPQTPIKPGFEPLHLTLSLEILWDRTGESRNHEFIFILGHRQLYKTVKALKEYIAVLPEGSSITWSPGCRRMGGEPLLSDDKAMEDFRQHCQKHKVMLIMIPSG